MSNKNLAVLHLVNCLRNLMVLRYCGLTLDRIRGLADRTTNSERYRIFKKADPVLAQRMKFLETVSRGKNMPNGDRLY